MNQIVYKWQCKKRIEVKKKIMFIGGYGLGFRKYKQREINVYKIGRD